MAAGDERPSFELVTDGDGATVRLAGAWTVETAGPLFQELQLLRLPVRGRLILDGAALSAVDTAGAWLIYRLGREARKNNLAVDLAAMRGPHRALIDEVAANDAPCPVKPPQKLGAIELLEDLGQGTVDLWREGLKFINFVGLVVVTIGRTIMKPQRLRLTSVVYHMEQVGVRAMPIVGLMAFLLGIVIAQQGEFQLRRFGAEVFVVDLVAISILREIAILITAIMLAGRSGSAFTAQIGSMVLNEEIDAMRTLGIDPIETLVLPRLLAIVLMTPLLTFYSDIIGIFGGGLFSWLALDMTPAAFIDRLNAAITTDSFLVGIIKAPFFAAVIALSGCFEGLKVSGGAESVGKQTTRSVVESIFLVIVLDAAFAVFFSAIDM